MTGKEFLNAVTNGGGDVLAAVLSLLEETGTDYCVIGGLAVNAYAEPVVSLDLDLVVVLDRIGELRDAARSKGMAVREFEHSVNLSLPKSDLRIQIQTDPRYQAFIGRSERRTVLGYDMSVARIEDVLQGKAWAFSDDSRRPSKRQKDLSDIMRLAETHPRLLDLLPSDIRSRIG